ncbi:MAG: ABC-2 family transporter protein [Deltaproteobacteria bacterium]|nr:ABC-2 family transporter protein [Deltaproteobacteria bacterium]
MPLALARVAVMAAMQYRASFLAEMAVGVLAAAGVAAPLFLVYAHVPAVAGWSFEEALLVTAFFLAYNAFVAGIIEPNLGAVVDGVRVGQLDYMLIRPVDAQLLLSFQKVAPAAAWELLASLAVGGVALSRLGPPTPMHALAALAMLGSGVAATYGLWLLVTCTSFWFVRVDNLRFLLGAITDAGRWPIGVYSGWVRIALTTVVPVALVTSYPAMALLGRLDLELALGSVAVAAASLIVSRLVLLRALAHYTSASS